MTEAQRLADALSEESDYDIHHEAKSCMRESAAELRRLDAVEAEWAALSQDDGKAQREIERLRAVNAELAGLLREIEDFMGADFDDLPMSKQVRAAIAATGETK